MADSDHAPDYAADNSLASRATNALRTSLRALVSKQAQRAYLGTVLFIATSLLMICVSSVAYGMFYFKFIPQVGFERVVHLQFGDGHPWGIASVGRELVALQPYDVTVKLELPRTPSNVAAGNFMLDLALLPRPSASAQAGANTATNAIAKSRRPAILTYTSPMIDTASKLSFMPLYLIGWHREAETMEVQMMEEVEFPRGWRNLPGSLRLEIHSDERMQVYNAEVQFRARFTGLRRIMYNWRLSSFLVFSFVFWSVSMLSTSVVWFVVASLASNGGKTKVKREQASGPSIKESDEESDASSQDSRNDSPDSPLKGKIKEERESEELGDIPASEVAGSQAESGAGTGLESPAARGVQRRRSHTFEGEHS